MAKKSSESTVSSVPAVMRPEVVSFEIVGISPLLQNNPASFIGADEGAGLATKKVYDDNDEATRRLYFTPDGSHYHPAEAFVKSMVKAAAGKKIGKAFATAALKGSVFIAEPHAIITDHKGKKPTWTVDKKPVVVGKARILRCRPMFSEWHIWLALEIDASLISKDVVRDCLSIAGRVVGVGDYRPEKGGGFGRFRVE